MNVLNLTFYVSWVAIRFGISLIPFAYMWENERFIGEKAIAQDHLLMWAVISFIASCLCLFAREIRGASVATLQRRSVEPASTVCANEEDVSDVFQHSEAPRPL